MSKLKANDVLLQVDLGSINGQAGPADWRDVACITGNGLDSASDNINGDSKCGIDQQPGLVSWTSPIEGFYELDPSATQISGEDLINMRQANPAPFYNWRMRNADNSYYRGFYGYLSGYSEDAPYNDLVKFTAEVSIKGALITSAPST